MHDVLAGDEIFAAREFENERLVERWNGGKVERVELFTAEKCAARMRRSTMRLSRST